MNYRQGNQSDINKFQELALKSWQGYHQLLTPDNWSRLRQSLTSASMFEQLLQQSFSVVCLTETEEIIGMSFLVPSGNPTDIYQNDWSYIRLVTVSPEYEGRGIGRQLTGKCIQHAKDTGERTVALHTSEIMKKARRLYESLGFKIIREIEPRFGKRYWIYGLDIE